MKEVTVYIAEDGQKFTDKTSCERHDEALKSWLEWAQTGSAEAKLNLLVNDLNKCQNTEGMVATCSHDTLRIKGMIRVCQKFIEDNKELLKYY